MCAMAASVPPLEADEVVRKFYEALSRGRMVDALDLFATDAVLQDAMGSESRGIRAITTALLEYRKPQAIALDRIESAGSDVRVDFRTKRSRRYRGLFSVDRGRIRSMRIEAIS